MNRVSTPLSKVDQYLSSMKIRDLKQSAISRGMPFRLVVESSVLNLQAWLMKHWDDDIDRTLLNDFDVWFETELREEGLRDLIHPFLRMGYLGYDEDGNEVRKQLKNIGVPMGPKTDKEIAGFRPKRGSKKELVFNLLRGNPGMTTSELVGRVQEQFEDALEGSIKSWASRARKSIKLQQKLDNANKK
jgi:hypothetical protein